MCFSHWSVSASQNIVKITTASHIVKNSANQLKSVELSTSGAAVLAPPNPMKEFFDFVQETVHIVSQKITNFFSPQHKPSHTQNTASNQNKGNFTPKSAQACKTQAEPQKREEKQYTSLSDIKALDKKLQAANVPPTKDKEKPNIGNTL